MTGIGETFLTNDEYFTGSALSEDMVRLAENRLGYRLPTAYLTLLAERNGGVPRRRCFRTSVATSWAPDHIEISALRGIGGEWGIDADSGLGTTALILEWAYPNIGIVLCETPSGGHDTVMLDYTKCGPQGEPAVVYIDEDQNGHRKIVPLGETFEAFCAGLYTCSSDDS